jgi:hypothetical protein
MTGRLKIVRRRRPNQRTGSITSSGLPRIVSTIPSGTRPRNVADRWPALANLAARRGLKIHLDQIAALQMVRALAHHNSLPTGPPFANSQLRRR